MAEINVNQKKYSNEYLNSAKDALKQKDASYGNGDGKLSVGEFQNKFAQLNNSVFANNPFLKSEAQSIIDSQDSLFKAYAGSDGILDADEYCNLINSKEYDKAITKWRELSNIMKEENEGAQSYLDRVDKIGNGDGKTTPEEFLEYQKKLYTSIFKDNQKLLKKALKLAQQEYEDVKKFSGNDGVFEIKEYLNYLKSEEKDKTHEQYRRLRDKNDASQSARTSDSSARSMSLNEKFENIIKKAFNIGTDTANKNS